MPLESNEAWIHPIKEIVVKKNKSGVPTPEEVYDSGNELSYEENLRAYQAIYGGRHDKRGDVGQEMDELKRKMTQCSTIKRSSRSNWLRSFPITLHHHHHSDHLDY